MAFMIPKTEPSMSRNPPHFSHPISTYSSAAHLNDDPFRMPQPAYSTPHRPGRHTEFTPEERTRIDEQLPKYLAPHLTATRSGPGRTTLTYIEGWKIKNLANRIFGFDGWSSSIMDVTVDFLDVDQEGRVNVGVSVMMRVTLKDGTFHEDIGYGSSENQRSKASSFEKAKKEAVTDGLKRALTSFGNLLGTCLYDKNFCKYLSTQRVEKPKFDPKDMYDLPTEGIARQLHQEQQQEQMQALNNRLQAQYQVLQHQHQQQQQTNCSTGSSSSASSILNQSITKPPSTSAQQVQHLGYSGGLLSNVVTQNVTPVRQPPAVAQAGSSNGVTAANSTHQGPSTAAHSANPHNQHSSQNNAKTDIKIEDEDDMFFGVDIEDTRASQPESPRMSDFDIIYMDADALNDSMEDSPVKPMAAVAEGTAPIGHATLRRSGSLTRSTSSPVLLHTTPTKLKASEPLKWDQDQRPLSSTGLMQTSIKSSAEASAMVFEKAFASKQTPPSNALLPTRTPTPPSSNQESLHSSRSTSSNLQLQKQRNWASKDVASVSPFPRSTVGQSGQPAMNGNRDVLRANSLAASNSSAANNHVPSSLPSSSVSNQNNVGHGYRATTPSAAQHSIQLANQAQGHGLKRPLGIGGSHDTNVSAASKEPRLG